MGEAGAATPSNTVFSAGLRSRLAGVTVSGPWDAPEVPRAPEAKPGIGPARQQLGEGLHLADALPGRLQQHLPHEARAELPARVEIEPGVVQDADTPVRRGRHLFALLGVSARSRSRLTCTRPPSDRAMNRDTGVRRDSGKVLSPITGSGPEVSTTTPTWFVQELVASATSRNGFARTRMNTTSPTCSADASEGTAACGNPVAGVSADSGAGAALAGGSHAVKVSSAAAARETMTRFVGGMRNSRGESPADCHQVSKTVTRFEEGTYSAI
jgi:hypothetical protein